jgi:hypothetical protein
MRAPKLPVLERSKMENLHDPKRMALRLREALAEKQIKITQGDALNIVARQFGLKEWNVLSAKLKAGTEPDGQLKLPDGWLKTGTSPHLFEAGLDPLADYLGKPVVVLKSKDEGAVDGFATLMQTIAAEKYLGKRIAISAVIRTLDTLGSATIWLRIDGADGGMLAFNNLETLTSGGALKGTEAWSRRRIVLDVSPSARTINFGFYLMGPGTAWFADFTFEEVATEKGLSENQAATEPRNLGFA